MEIALFRKPKKVMPQTMKALKNATRTCPASQCLIENKRQQLLQKMRMLSGLETSRYDNLCTTLIENFVLYCQQLPETNTSYYSHAGGLVDHALNRTEAALSLFQSFMLLENQTLSEIQTLWQYALYSAAILQNIGTLFVDFKINVFDAQGQFQKQWNPLAENLFKAGPQYDYELQAEPDTSFRHRLNLLLAKMIMPKSGFAWIASNPQVLMVWLALLNDDYQGAGTLGALLIRADAIAIQRYFHEFLDKIAMKRTAFGHAGTFIDGAAAESVLDKEQALGLEFLQWLTKSLEEGKLILNKGPLIMVPGGLLMTQEIFELFVAETKLKNWQTVQKGFLALGLYVRGGDGRAILRFDSNKGMVNGIVFSKFALVLPESVKTQHGESMSAVALINQVQQGSQYAQKLNKDVLPLQHLNAAGNWQVDEKTTETLGPGVKQGA